MSSPTSALASAVTSPDDQVSQQVQQNIPAAATNAPTGNTSPAPPSGGSRLLAILGAVAKVGTDALAGIPDKGRSTFVTGLGEGSIAELAAQATQQAIKFKSFDDQLRMAELHNQDLKMQNDTQPQPDAHTQA